MIVYVENGRYIFYKPEVTKDWLRQNGFRYAKDYSDETDIYIKRVPLHKYKRETTIEGEIAMNATTGDTTVNVMVARTKSLYPTYYNTFYGNQEGGLLCEIDRNILKEFKKLGIIRKKGKRNGKGSRI